MSFRRATPPISPRWSSASTRIRWSPSAPFPQQRRPALAYGAVVLEEIIRRGKPGKVVISIGGLREGLLYEKLEPGNCRRAIR